MLYTVLLLEHREQFSNSVEQRFKHREQQQQHNATRNTKKRIHQDSNHNVNCRLHVRLCNAVCVPPGNWLYLFAAVYLLEQMQSIKWVRLSTLS